jgi:hypothetical protein
MKSVEIIKNVDGVCFPPLFLTAANADRVLAGAHVVPYYEACPLARHRKMHLVLRVVGRAFLWTKAFWLN